MQLQDGCNIDKDEAEELQYWKKLSFQLEWISFKRSKDKELLKHITLWRSGIGENYRLVRRN